MSEINITTYARIFVGALILQQAVDELAGDKKTYFNKVKYASKNLAEHLKPIIEKGYKKLGEEEQQGLHAVWNMYEATANVLARLTTEQLYGFGLVIDKLGTANDEQFAEMLAILESYLAGEVFMAKTPELLEKFIEQKRVVPIGDAAK